MKINPSRVVKPLPNLVDFTCPICEYICVDPLLTPCEQLFCRKCILKRVRQNRVCPTCGEEITKDELTTASKQIRNLINEFDVYCSKGTTIHKLNQIDSHEKQCNGCNPYDTVIYVYCDPKKNFDGTDVKIENIVDYVIRDMGIIEDGDNGKKTYENYCNAFRKRFGSHPPYQKAISLKQWDRKIATEQMKSLIPIHKEQFNGIIHESVEKLVNSKTKFDTAEFKVLKVVRSGESIDLCFCYLAVNLLEERSWFFWTTRELCMSFHQKKFTILKDDIKQMINSVKMSCRNWSRNR
jgi:hypothetical protein